MHAKESKSIERELTISRLLNAPIQLVWEVWTNPDHIKNWYHASPDWHALNAENNVSEDAHFKTE